MRPFHLTVDLWGHEFPKFKTCVQVVNTMATKAIKSKYEERFVGNYGHNTSEQLTRNSRIFFLGKLYKQKRMI